MKITHKFFKIKCINEYIDYINLETPEIIIRQLNLEFFFLIFLKNYKTNNSHITNSINNKKPEASVAFASIPQVIIIET